jgi:hypothetical protein
VGNSNLRCVSLETPLVDREPMKIKFSDQRSFESAVLRIGTGSDCYFITEEFYVSLTDQYESISQRHIS